PLKQGPTRRVAGPYVADPDPSKTMLGDDQWKWLAERLLEPAEIRLVVSSIQCLPEAAGQETWSNLPAERKKLLDLLRSTSANGVILLSGDRHWAELSVLRDEIGYPLYELTSSSLNQKHPRGTPSENRFRAVPQTFHQENFGVIDLDWSQTRPEVELRLLDTEGQPRISQRVVF
ncbi:MAG: alkaline phosphatase D family protein, partial [Rubripirellula sp.]|nr:alkaline phosphatase D family protein [Rubripirellula sp.]